VDVVLHPWFSSAHPLPDELVWVYVIGPGKSLCVYTVLASPAPYHKTRST